MGISSYIHFGRHLTSTVLQLTRFWSIITHISVEQCLLLPTSNSVIYELKCRVPQGQGSILHPLHFNLYILSLENVISCCESTSTVIQTMLHSNIQSGVSWWHWANWCPSKMQGFFFSYKIMNVSQFPAPQPWHNKVLVIGPVGKRETLLPKLYTVL